MDQAVKGLLIQSLAQGQRAVQTLREPVGIDLRLNIHIDDAGDDFGIRIDRHQCQRTAMLILKDREGAGGQRLGAPVGHHLVGIGPGKAVTDAPRVHLGTQADYGAGLGLGCE